MIDKIIFASKNNGKVKEVKNIFNDLNIELLCLNDFDDIPDIVEDGNSFEENAKIKAKIIFNHFKIATISDDSGLSVERLGGNPGIYSARYAKVNATDEENNSKLISELSKFSEPHKAKYICAAAFYNGNKFIISVGVINGKIVLERKGNYGFGYDPYFVPNGYKKTMAEIEPAEKNKISHRAQAFNKLKNILFEKEN